VLGLGIIVGIGVMFLQNWRKTRQYEEQYNEERRRVSKDNFLKLKVGMTLEELEDVIGVGKPAREDLWHMGWQKAVQEYRVRRWHGDGGVNILAGFSEPPSAATKVEALSFRDGYWDEDKGALSGLTK
jgi:hypothetical protein